EFDVVVVGWSNGFAPGKVSTDSVRFGVPTHPDNVKPCRIVTDVDVRGLRGRFSIRRLLLGEAADLAKLGCRTVRLMSSKSSSRGGVLMRGICASLAARARSGVKAVKTTILRLVRSKRPDEVRYARELWKVRSWMQGPIRVRRATTEM